MSGLDVQLEKSKYNSPVCKKIGWRWRNSKSHIQFIFHIWYESVASWFGRVAESLVTWVRFLMSADSFCSASAMLCGTELISALTCALFILLRSLYFFFLGFRQWRSRENLFDLPNLLYWHDDFSFLDVQDVAVDMRICVFYSPTVQQMLSRWTAV